MQIILTYPKTILVDRYCVGDVGGIAWEDFFFPSVIDGSYCQLSIITANHIFSVFLFAFSAMLYNQPQPASINS